MQGIIKGSLIDVKLNSFINKKTNERVENWQGILYDDKGFNVKSQFFAFNLQDSLVKKLQLPLAVEKGKLLNKNVSVSGNWANYDDKMRFTAEEISLS